MANPIDVTITPEALKQMKDLAIETRKAQEAVLKLAQDALTASRNISQINSPAGFNNNSTNNRNNATNITNETANLRQLNTERQRGNQATAEEIVNQRILNRNALEQARINSQLAGAYGRLNAQHAEASRRVQDLVARGRIATQTQRQYNAELRNAQREFNNLNNRVTLADRAVGRFNRNVGNYPQIARGFSELLGAFGIGAGIGLIASITKDIFNQTRELQSLDLALKQVIGTQEDFARAQSFISRVSEQYGVGIKELTKSYTQFYVSAKDKLSGQEIEGIFESIAKASGAMGLSVEQQEGAFLALTQMLSKGTIQAEELRGQLSERLPGAFGILAKSMGVTEVELNKLLKDGKVLAAEVLPAFAKELEKAYGIENLNRVESLNASTTRLSNSWTNFIRSINEGDGAVTEFFAFFVDGTNSALKGLGRLNTSWNDLFEKAKTQGLDTGKGLFKTQLENLIGTGDDKEIAKSIKTVAERNYNALMWEFGAISQKIDEDIKKFEGRDRLSQLLIGGDGTKRLDLIKKEDLYKQLAEQVAIIDEANKLISGNVEKKNKKVIELTQKEKDALAKKEEERQRLLFTNSQKELELRLITIDKTLENEDMFYQERLTALELHRVVRMQMLANQYKEDLRLSKGNQLKEKEALLDYHASTLKDIEKYNNRKTELETLRPTSRGIVSTAPDAQKQLEESAKKATEALENETEATEAQRLALIELQKATDDYIKSFSDSFLADAGLGSLQKFFDGTFDKLLMGADTLKEKFAVTFLAISEVAKEAFNFINQASQQNFDAEYRRLEMQKEVAVKFAGDSTTAQERITTEYDRRKREIQRREAEAQKRIAVFNILINTAQGVVSALTSTPPNVPLSIAIGLIGALQAGIVQAQPIPQFFEGGTHKGGIMMVNDAKGNSYKETIVTPDGKVIKPHGRNVLMNAPAGTEIFTPEQWKAKENAWGNILSERGISFNPNVMRNFAFGGPTGLSKSDFDNGISTLSKNIKNATKPLLTIDKKGIRLFEIEGAKRTERLNRRFDIR